MVDDQVIYDWLKMIHLQGKKLKGKQIFVKPESFLVKAIYNLLELLLGFLRPGRLVTELLSFVRLTRVNVSLRPPVPPSGTLLVLESLTFLDPWGLE